MNVSFLTLNRIETFNASNISCAITQVPYLTLHQWWWNKGSHNARLWEGFKCQGNEVTREEHFINIALWQPSGEDMVNTRAEWWGNGFSHGLKASSVKWSSPWPRTRTCYRQFRHGLKFLVSEWQGGIWWQNSALRFFHNSKNGTREWKSFNLKVCIFISRNSLFTISIFLRQSKYKHSLIFLHSETIVSVKRTQFWLLYQSKWTLTELYFTLKCLKGAFNR